MTDSTRRLTSSVCQVGRIMLRVVEGLGGNQVFHLDLQSRPRLVGGRVGHANDVALSDEAVSACHFELLWSADGLVIRDLDSTNGVWIGPVRLREAVLAVGCRFRVGDTHLALEHAEAVEVPLWERESFAGMHGGSEVMRELFARLARVAARDLPAVVVLLLGETGVGKELAAHALHSASRRAKQPFVPVNCAAIPPELAEGALFGHARGSFTGASEARVGYFEAANGGTLFLDEIGDLPLPLQPKLLRVLAEREIQRVGETRVVPVDVRVVAATRRDLARMVAEGRFGEDLYHRLAGVVLRVPSLREHSSDIPLLAEAFLAELCPQLGVELRLDAGALRRLQEVSWPGNVRQLRQALLRTAIFVDGPVIRAEHLELDASERSLRLGLGEAGIQSVLERVERWLYAHILAQHPTRAAQAAAAELTTEGLRRGFRRLGIPIGAPEEWAVACMRTMGCPLCTGL